MSVFGGKILAFIDKAGSVSEPSVLLQMQRKF
jgi:acyl-CoA hydrolase